VKENGQEFYIDERGRTVLDEWRTTNHHWEANAPFVGGVAWLKRRDGDRNAYVYRCIDKNGAVLSSVEVGARDDVSIKTTFLVVEEASGFSVYELQGRVHRVEGAKYLTVREDGFCSFKGEDGYWRMFRFGDREKTVVFPVESTTLSYDVASGVVSCVMRGRASPGVRFFDIEGNPLTKLDAFASAYEKCLYCKFGMIGVWQFGKCGVMDVDGTMRVPVAYDEVNIIRKYQYGCCRKQAEDGNSVRSSITFYDRDGVRLCTYPIGDRLVGWEVGDWCVLSGWSGNDPVWINPKTGIALRYDADKGAIERIRLTDAPAG
jgi:hypothetical protein